MSSTSPRELSPRSMQSGAARRQRKPSGAATAEMSLSAADESQLIENMRVSPRNADMMHGRAPDQAFPRSASSRPSKKTSANASGKPKPAIVEERHNKGHAFTISRSKGLMAYRELPPPPSRSRSPPPAADGGKWRRAAAIAGAASLDCEAPDADEVEFLQQEALPATPRDQLSPRNPLDDDELPPLPEPPPSPPEPESPPPSFEPTELSGLSVQFNKQGRATQVKLEHAGWLTKKGKRRWFVLRGDTLFWFSKRRALDSDLAKGANNLLPLLGCVAEPCASIGSPSHSPSLAGGAGAAAAAGGGPSSPPAGSRQVSWLPPSSLAARMNQRQEPGSVDPGGARTMRARLTPSLSAQSLRSLGSTVAGNHASGEFSFRIEPPTGKAYVLGAASRAEMNVWLTVLSAAARANDRDSFSDDSTAGEPAEGSLPDGPVRKPSLRSGCQGYLVKRGKRRFFVVEGGQLKWYLSDKQRREELRGCLPLHDCRLKAHLATSTLVLESTGEAKQYTLTAQSPEECGQWHLSLEQAIDRAVKAQRQRVSAARRKSFRDSFRSMAMAVEQMHADAQGGQQQQQQHASSLGNVGSAPSSPRGSVPPAGSAAPKSYLQFSIPYTVPVSGANMKSFTAYMVEVTDLRDKSTQSLLKRYRQFEALQSTFQRLYDRAVLPSFPPKRLVGNMSASFVSSRRLHLERWLRAIARLPGALEVPELVYFFTEEQIEDGWQSTQPALTSQEIVDRWQWMQGQGSDDGGGESDGARVSEPLVSIQDPKSKSVFVVERGREGEPPWISRGLRSPPSSPRLMGRVVEDAPGGGVLGALQRTDPAVASDTPDDELSAAAVDVEGTGVDGGGDSVTNADDTGDSSDFVIEDVVEKDFAYYATYFADASHDNFVSDPNGLGGRDEESGPFIVSITSEPAAQGLDTSTKSFKAIVRSKRGDERLTVSLTGKSGRLERLRAVQQQSATRGLADARLARVAPALTTRLADALSSFERKMVVSRYKFGVLYVRPGQSDENDMYANHEVQSDAFDRFLSVLGDRIALQGWSKYTGGLDVRHGSTGSHSVYTQYKQFEIMFHVAPFLPYQPDDTQHVERKRHLGNDIVLVVFCESPDQTFDPSALTSHFNHCFICVRPCSSVADGSTDANDASKFRYRIEVCCKPGVRPVPPFLPPRCTLAEGPAMRAFLLTKLVNLERSAMSAPEFVGLTMRTRNLLLTDIIKDFQ